MLDVEESHGAEAAFVEALLARAGVEVSGAVLDIGGGPGFAAAWVARRAQRVVLTEIVDVALSYARERLGLETRRFDFDGAPLDACVEGPFDLLLCRYALAWCMNLPRLAAGMAAVASPGGLAVLSFVLPTRGVLIGTAREAHPPWVLWSPGHVERVFADAGWQLQSQFEPLPPIPYWRLHSPAFRLVSWPRELLPGPLPRDPMQRHAGLVLRYRGPSR